MYRIKGAFNYALSALLSPSPYPSDRAPRLLSRLIDLNWQGKLRRPIFQSAVIKSDPSSRETQKGEGWDGGISRKVSHLAHTESHNLQRATQTGLVGATLHNPEKNDTPSTKTEILSSLKQKPVRRHLSQADLTSHYS